MADNLNKIERVGKVSMDVFLRAGLNTVGNFAQRIQQAIDVLYLKKKDPSLIIILERSCSSCSRIIQRVRSAEAFPFAPSKYMCPISLDWMEDPVVTPVDSLTIDQN